MATTYPAATGASPATMDPSSPPAQWQEQPRNGTQESSNFRSVTPAMNNTRGVVRNASPAAAMGHPMRGASPGGAAKLSGGSSAVEAHYNPRSGTPSRYLGAFNSPDATQQQQHPPRDQTQHPASTGLIRLTLRKPMGIVFEPMYDPNNPSVQRGVRICDLPRTGAAALSRKLEVGDELLSINDKTMSRLTFDEIMDFIIEADPEEVNLLFRRPRKEALNSRHSASKMSNPNSSSGVKWVDDEQRNKRKDKKRGGGDKKSEKKSTRRPKHKDDDETLQSEDVDYRRGRKKGRRKDPYESESFLDILIDTICANPDNVCRDRRRNGDDEYYSDDDDDGTFGSRDDSTYVTYESEEQPNKKKEKSKAKGQNRDDDSSTYEETEDDTLEDTKRKKKREKDSNRLSPPKESKRSATPEKNKKSEKYEDDGTLETVDSTERPKPVDPEPEQAPPLGLAPHPNPEPSGPGAASDTDDDGNPAPIRELEYDDQVDHGADVSVMESLGGPSLLIEKQRQAAITAAKSSVPAVPPEIIQNFGKDYPVDFGSTLEQSIQNDPLRFYTHIVKGLLQEHEPEKVRLLDKLLAKYKGREDHLVQKLSVRYNKEDEGTPTIPEDGRDGEGEDNFEEAVNKGKDSATASAAIKTAKERMQTSDHDFAPTEWPDKETKEPDEEDRQSATDEGGSDTASDYSGDSIDGTSPAVIAQVSELLNYVYGKTSVPGQIDRVSTIMRAYEGREAVLLELLETKALIKANREKENAGNLPSFLRNSANAQRNLESEINVGADVPPVTPMATQQHAVAGTAINDDISSMSGVSSPAAEGAQQGAILKQISVSSTHSFPLRAIWFYCILISCLFGRTYFQAHETAPSTTPAHTMNVETKVVEHHDMHEQPEHPEAPTPSSGKSSMKPPPTPDRGEKKKKKGIFGGLFGGKKGKKSKEPVQQGDRPGSRPRGLRSPMSRKLKNMSSTEGSI